MMEVASMAGYGGTCLALLMAGFLFVLLLAALLQPLVALAGRLACGRFSQDHAAALRGVIDRALHRDQALLVRGGDQVVDALQPILAGMGSDMAGGIEETAVVMQAERGALGGQTACGIQQQLLLATRRLGLPGALVQVRLLLCLQHRIDAMQVEPVLEHDPGHHPLEKAIIINIQLSSAPKKEYNT